MSNFVTKGGIVFNVDDPDQKDMLEHVNKRKNYSGYMKRLIWNDMKGTTIKKALYNEETKIEQEKMFDSSLMKGMI